MKKFLVFITITFLLASLPGVVSANSAPVFWQGYPSSSIMMVDTDSPVIIKGEDLVFDFNQGEDLDYAQKAKVTAAYQMLNPTNSRQTVQMAFPFIEALSSLRPDDILITADGLKFPYKIYLGESVESRGSPGEIEKDVSLDFTAIAGAISEEQYEAGSFEALEKGKLYTIEVRPTGEERINLAVDFTFDSRQTKILTYGFNRYERDEKKTRIAAWCYEPEVLEIYVLGEDVTLHVDAYSDGELHEKTNLYSHQIITQQVEVKSYLLDYLQKKSEILPAESQPYSQTGISVFFAENQLYNLYAQALDEAFSRNIGYCSEHDLWAKEHNKRILTLVYTVEFPENSTKEISVSYTMGGTMDKTQTVNPLYSYVYLLNPARNWKAFENLKIKIFPPEEAPFIVESTIDFVPGEERVYTASLKALPEEDLSFTLYAAEQITLLDKLQGRINNTFGYFTPLVIGAIAVLMLGVIIRAILKWVEKKSYHKE